jgi:signal transduction histidine kinase
MSSPIDLNILVVDQDAIERSLVRHLAESFEWTVSEAASVQEMAAWLRARFANDLACVLVTYPLPDGDAFDALAASKAIRADFPVVLLAEEKDADVVLRILNSGAAAYLERTALSESRLGQVIRRAMRSKGANVFGEHALLAAAFQQLPVALLITDRFGNVILHNAKWVQLLGQTLGSLDNVAEMLERARATIPQTPSDRADLLQALVENRPYPLDFTLGLDNHETALVRLRQSPILDEAGQLIGSMALFEDLSHQQQPRVMQKACHDLRNPLSAIMINANILSRDAAQPDERRVKMATRILSSATRMNRLLADLFDYSATAQGQDLSIQARDADLKLIASETLAEVRAEYPGRALVLEANGDLRGRWDPGRLGQMLHNIVAAVLKRSSTRASLLISCNELGAPPSIEIRVGINHDSLNIDLTMRLQATEPADGFDPGLYVAERIVEAHQGTFEVPSSGAGDATTFVVRLPKTSGAAMEPAPEAASTE